MMRNPNDNNYFVSPIRSPGEFDESLHSDAKKSKNRHLAIINQLRRREDAWDGRFHLDNIPNYRFNEDKHCETYKKMLIKKKNKKIVVRADSKIQTPSDIGIRKRNYEDQSADYNYRRPDSQQSAIGVNGLRGINPRNIQSRDKSRGDSIRKYTPLQETLLKEKKFQEERLAALWDKWNIPMFHRETFLKCENAQNPKQTIEILRREADDIEATCSAIQLGIRAVTARENCLKQLKLLVNKLERSEAGSNNDLINEEEAKQKASELLTHLRILSLNAVETILKWREYIQQAYYITRGVVKANQTIIIPFLFNDNNYLIKMKNDIKSLTESSLARFFNFSSKSDPFLVYPSKETNADDKIVLYISKNLINRIRACELVILEESVHEHMDKSTPQTAGKAHPHDSDRSAPKHEEKPGQKQSNIRIRNVKNDNKKLSAGPTSATHKPESETKITTGSHGAIPEQRQDTHHRNQHVSEQPKQASSVDKISDHAMSPERESPKKTEQKSPERETIKSDYSQTFSPVKESPVKKEKEESPAKKDHAHIHLVSPVKGVASEHVKPVDVYEDEIEDLVTEYLRDVDDNMKGSFISDPKVLLERANMGQDPTWFKFINAEDGHKRVGLAVTHIDSNVFTTRRMVILHCTTVNRELYAEYLGKLVEYLWNSDECNEIKISLYHLEDANANLGADKELSEAIKKLGFRWKQLTNDKITGKRYIDYILKRPEGKVYQGQKFNDEPIHVESVVVLSDLQGADLNQSYEHKELVDNRFAILGAVLKHCDEKVDQLAEGDSKRHKNYLTHITSLIKEEKAKIGEIVEKFHNLDEMVNFVGQKFENKDEFLPTIDQKHLTNKYTTSLLNLIYRWKSFNITHHKIAGKDREYLKINNNTDLVQFQSKYENSSIYFIPTDDAQVNIYLTDNQTLVNKIVNKEEIIEDVVSKLFSKLDKNPTAFDKDLWIPMFSMHQRNVDLETAKELLKGEDKINFAKSTNIIGLNGNRVNGNLKVRPSEKSKIIEKAFLFGIVHEHVDFPMVSVVVQPEDFLEYNI